MDRCYIGIRECGCVPCAMVDSLDEDYIAETLKEWREDGKSILLVSIEEARERLGFCKVHNLNQRSKK